jgi:hypothetical protein
MSMHGNNYDDLHPGHHVVTQDRLLHAALKVAADAYDEPVNPSGHEAASSEYLLKELALAARAHTAAINRLPAESQPVNWSKGV